MQQNDKRIQFQPFDERIEHLESNLEQAVTDFVNSFSSELNELSKAKLNDMGNIVGYSYGIIPETRDKILSAVSKELAYSFDFLYENGDTYSINPDDEPEDDVLDLTQGKNGRK